MPGALGPPGAIGKPGFPGKQGPSGAPGQHGADAQVKEIRVHLKINSISVLPLSSTFNCR